MEDGSWVDLEDRKPVVTIVCVGCDRHVMMKSCRAVTVMMEKGWDHRWYCPECYDGFEYGRDY